MNQSIHISPAGDDSAQMLAERVADGEWSVPVSPCDAAMQWPYSPRFLGQHGKTGGIDYVINGPLGMEIGYAHISTDDLIADAAIVFLAGRKDIWERGIGTDIFMCLTEECVNSIGASHVWIQFPENDLTIHRIVERCNFIHEATLHVPGCSGLATDSALVFGVLAHRFRRLCEMNGP